MARFDLTSLSVAFDMEAPGIDFDSGSLHGSTRFDYASTAGDMIEVSGRGFAAGVGSIPQGGTADGVAITLENGVQTTPDITIDGFSRAISSFVFDEGDASQAPGYVRAESNQFWSALLGGDDRVVIGDAPDELHFAGDGVYVEISEGRASGGDDVISGGLQAGSGLYGDYFSLSEGVIDGGADEITATYLGPFRFHADAPGVELADVTVVGDVREVEDDTTVFGGDDVLTLRRGGLAAGDAFLVNGGLVGGDDRITGGGAVRLVGDAWDVEVGANVTGGDDVLRGGRGSQILVGDFGALQDDSAIGGDDIIRGGRGDDFIFGEFEIGRIGRVKQGADRLFGNAGDDHIYGQAGFDKLWGGTGDDVLSGGPGRDVIFTGSGHDTVEVGPLDGFEVVRDFDLSFDHIDLTTSATSFDDLEIRERRGDALIVSDHTRILLVGVDGDDLDASHFDIHSV